MARVPKFFRQILSRQASCANEPPSFPAPPICVIGDVHGRADLLERMLARIAQEDPEAKARCVLVGDLIDRGPDSAQVLDMVRALCVDQPQRWICLAGNHEQMLLDFLDDPARLGPRWLAAGGDATLLSYGLAAHHDRNRKADFTKLGRDLAAALGVGLIDWLRNLPMIWHEGKIVVSHAGIDPGRSLDDQDVETLLWGRRLPRKSVGRRENQTDAPRFWVVQGHVVHEEPVMRGRRIYVDTGAWFSGRLSAAWLEAGLDQPRWITVQDDDG